MGCGVAGCEVKGIGRMRLKGGKSKLESLQGLEGLVYKNSPFSGGGWQRWSNSLCGNDEATVKGI